MGVVTVNLVAAALLSNPLNVIQVSEDDQAAALQRAGQSVFHIEGRQRRDGPWIEVGSGFLIKDGGWAITNYHVARHLIAARGIFEGDTFGNAQLWAIWPEYDIALLKLSNCESRTALAISEIAPAVGLEVWAAGYSQFGYTVTRGIVNGVRQSSDMTSVYGWPRGLAADSTWLQTDCTINPGNSGGPLINAKGEVVGVNTWRSRLGDNMYFALSAEHLQALFTRRPEEPLTFEGLLPDLPDDVEVHLADFSDLPSVELEATENPGRLVQSVRYLHSTSACRTCRGTGTVSTRVQRGWENSGNTMRRPNMVNEARKCSACNGTKVNSETIAIWLLRVAQAYVEADESHGLFHERVAAATSQFRGFAKEHAASVQTWVSASSPRKEWSVGDVVLFCARNGDEVDLPGLDNPVQLILSGDLVVMRDTRHMLAQSLEGKRIIAGGVLVGWLGEDQRYPVVQHGFIVDY